MSDKRIPDQLIQSIKQNTPLLPLFRSYGLPMTRRGSSWATICPFHPGENGGSETKPSLSIDKAKNRYHCFACNCSGDPIQFIMDFEKLPFPQAVEKALALVPQPAPAAEKGGAGAGSEQKAAFKKENGLAVPQTMVAEKEMPQPLSDAERRTILREVVNNSVRVLRESAPGREYLQSRGLDLLELLKDYTIGFWNGNQYPNLADEERQKLTALGLLNGNRGFFENCVLFPLTKDNGVGTIYGRKAAPGDTEGKHYLSPGSRRGLFLPRNGLDPRKPVVLTESIIDGLSLYNAGIRNVLPLLGVNGFLPDHLAYLKEQTFPAIFIALDGDAAGMRAATALREKLAADGLHAEIIELPAGKDINDMLCEMGPANLNEWFSQRIAIEDGKPTLWEDGGDVYLLLADREYRIRGKGLEAWGMDRLQVNIKVYRLTDRNTFYIDKFDLYQARGREQFISQASRVLNVERSEMVRDANTLITVLEEYRLSKQREQEQGKVYVMSEDEKQEALDYLKAPDLIKRIVADFEACGMVGNRNNFLLAYLVSLSRLCGKALGVLFVARSGAGKSALQDTVAAFTPEEYQTKITRITGQSLFYKEKDGIKHKLLNIEEDEGMKDAMFAIRVLLSSQRLHLESVKHDQKSGEMRDFQNIVEGPASIMIATTDLSAFDHETLTRFLRLYIDESPEQTAQILSQIDRINDLEGLEMKMRFDRTVKIHQNMQRLLKPVMVINRIGIGMDYPPEVLHSRREKSKVHTLLQTITLLHQYQRPLKRAKILDSTVEYIEVTQSDIETLREYAGDILKESLGELSRLCRNLLADIVKLAQEKHRKESMAKPELQLWQVSFTRKELMERCGWSMWHLREHLDDLEERGYIVKRIGKQGQRYAYSLVDSNLPALPDLRGV